MVKPGGTGRPRLAISARFAPLPPRRSRISARPSALPSPKAQTHLARAGGFVAAGRGRSEADCGADCGFADAAVDRAAFAVALLLDAVPDFAAAFGPPLRRTDAGAGLC